MPEPDPYNFPPELLSLQGKAKKFQLHYDPDCTKDRQVFILDTCWDDIPLLVSNVSALPESNASSSSHTTPQTASAETKDDTPATPTGELLTPETKTNPTPVISTPSKRATANIATPDTFDIRQTDDAPPAEQTPVSETSKPENERPKRGTRRALFTEAKETQETTSHKKSKKTD